MSLQAITSTPHDSIEVFARVCASLDDPFADRRAILGHAGLDDEGLALLQASWAQRLASEGGDELTMLFARAYATARADGRARRAEGDLEGPAARLAEAVMKSPEEREPAPCAPVELPTFMRDVGSLEGPIRAPFSRDLPGGSIMTETAAIDVSRILKPVVPFRPSGPPATPAAVASVSSKARPRGMSSGTAAVDVAKIVGEPLPFEARGTVMGERHAREGSARRLVRFDPLTGEPLAQPYWEELVTTESKS